MATMIPENVERFKTDGERQFYKFLETVAKPDSRYFAWYTPDIKDREPDFILFSEKTGLIIFEVKDWDLGQIIEATPHQFRLRKGAKTESHQNPQKQVRDYFWSLKDTIQKDANLISKDPKHHGNPKIPMDCGVVFPNITKYDYLNKGLSEVIDTDKILFWDDLHPQSDICCDKTGQCFLGCLLDKFPPRFSFSITGKDYKHLKRLLFPTVCIDLPERGTCAFEEQERQIKILDNNQEAIARKFDGGHRIISGASGTGKTLILVHKAAFLKQYNPSIKKILFICFNITLVNYIKRLIAAKGLGIGENGVEVYHFFELCSKILDEAVNYENEGDEYYEVIVELTLSRLKEENIQYDAILVDEGQDISDNMYRVITSLLNKDTNNLTIAIDEGQNLYKRKLSWKDVGVSAPGRVHRLSCVYRNTLEICRFADRFIDQSIMVKESDDMELFPGFGEFHGPEPDLIKLENLDETVTYTADKIKELHDKQNIPLSEISVIYCKKHFGDEEARRLPKMLERALNSRGILCTWAAENYFSKRSYDITTDRVTISTIHSTKGLDYACVFLIGLDRLEKDGWTDEQLTNMTYSAITRARYQLYVPFITTTPIINRLQKCIKQN